MLNLLSDWSCARRSLLGALCVLFLFGTAVAAPPNYLIVTAPDFASSDSLEDLRLARIARGFNVSTYVVPVDTNRADIKQYIVDLWGTPDAPDYILIVGDTDGSVSTSNTIPHWSGGGSKSATTDLPYACMGSGDDWIPDIAIGRLSVRTEAQLQAIVDKTLWVESGNYPDADYVKRATFLATSDNSAEAEATHDWVITNYIDPIGYTANRIYANQGGGTSDIADALNTGTLFLVYFGHSGSGGWWTPGFGQGDIANLTNEGLYGLVFGFSCSTAHYEYDECFGETWIREAGKGSAAYISSSTFIYYGGNEWESSRRLEKYFFESFFVDGIWELGPAWQAGLRRFREDPDYGTGDISRNMHEMFAVLGDPALLLPTFGSGSGMSVSPFGDLSSEGSNGGPFSPKEKSYTISNHDPTPISYSVSTAADWINIGNASGTLLGDEEVVVTVSINDNANNLANGFYEAVIDFVNETNHDGDTTREVELEVGVPVPVYIFPFDSDPGWSTEGLWAFGRPMGGGSYGGDPLSGYTGEYVYGYNLDGDYPDNMEAEFLTSSPIDCSNLSAVSIKFMRWLGVESSSFDSAAIQASNDGVNWQSVWNHNSGLVDDGSWRPVEYDVSDIATQEEQFQIRWQMGPSDYMMTYAGWNIDDVEIWGIENAPACAAFDLDGSGFVGTGDINIVKANYGATTPATEAYDLDGSGFVGTGDINIIKANYGACP